MRIEQDPMCGSYTHRSHVGRTELAGAALARRLMPLKSKSWRNCGKLPESFSFKNCKLLCLKIAKSVRRQRNSMQSTTDRRIYTVHTGRCGRFVKARKSSDEATLRAVPSSTFWPSEEKGQSFPSRLRGRRHSTKH